MNPTQAICWIAQLTNKTKMRGGQTNLYNDDVNVAAVPLDLITVFTVSSNTFTDTYHAPTKTWYRDGKVWTGRPATVEYLMQDGSLLTVTSTASGLQLTQQY